MSSPYLLLPIVFIVLLVYAITYILVKIDVISKISHRKIWNTLLALTFIVTAILGLILTVQVNNKIEIPYIKQLLKWHVDFGIGMALIGIIHFIWHWNYYKKLFKKDSYKNIPEKKTLTTIKTEIKPEVYITIPIVAGFNAIVFQVVLIRELMNIFYGNELVTGLVLATWMAITGIGAVISGYKINFSDSHTSIIRILIGLAVIPVITYIILYITKWLFFPPGILIDIRYMIPLILLLMTPYCLLSGFFFSYLVALYKNKIHGYRPDKLYLFETIGSIIGGISISFIFLFWFSAFNTLLVLLILQVLYIFFLHKTKSIKKIVFYSILICTGFILLILSTDKWLKSLIFQHQTISKNIETPYGNVIITKQASQDNIYTNHNLLYSSDNTIENEENVHYAMLQHKDPRNILIVSEGNIEMIREVLKYPTVENIDFVMENKWLMKVIPRADSILNNKIIHNETINIRTFLKSNSSIYDVILLATHDPTTLQSNRYFTYEFFSAIQKHTNKRSIICFSLASTNNYPSPENIAIHSLTLQTLQSVFKNTIIISGERDYFLSSQAALTHVIGKLLLERKINNNYVNPYYIDDFLLEQKSKLLQSQLKPVNYINKDFKPIAVFLNNNLFLSIFSARKYLLFIIVFLLLVPLISLKKGDIAMYAAGFSISSFEILVLMAFQVVFGYIYAASGIIFGICMTGLAIGAYLGSFKNNKINTKKIIINQALLGIFILILILGIIYYHSLKSTFLIYILFFGSTVIPSILAGLQFSFVVQYKENTLGKISGKVYGMDLFGSALGAYITSVILLPLVGFLNVGIIILVVNLLTCLTLSFTKK